MVAYSFQACFVHPIRIGLGLDRQNGEGAPQAKRHTIRAIGKRRHARPGEELQLYRGMRTKHCFLIGRARCVYVEDITIRFATNGVRRYVDVADVRHRTAEDLDAFAVRDGFATWGDLCSFWEEHHPVEFQAGLFQGKIIGWKPL